MPILWHLKVSERGNAITQRKTLEIEHLFLFIHHTIWIYPCHHLAVILTMLEQVLETPKKGFVSTITLWITLNKINLGKNIMNNLDHVYLRHLLTECQLILSADMATDTQSIYRPTLGRYVGRDSVECRSTWTNKHVGQHPADTLPTLGQHYAHLVSSCYRVLSSLLYWERLSVAVVLFWPLTLAIFMSFFQLCFFLIIAFIYDPRYFLM